jgi:phenylacetate-CoA ligase
MSIKSWAKSSALSDIAIRRPPLFYGYCRSWLGRWKNWSPEKKSATQMELTVRTIHRAAETPYGKKFEWGGSLKSWPFLEKETLRDHSRNMRAKTLLPVNTAQTGGTTGIPLVLTRSWQSVVFEQAILDHLVAENCGVEWRKARVAVLRGETLKPLSDTTPPFHKVQQGGRVLTLSSYHLNSTTLPHYLEALQNFCPDMLWAYPSALQSLCGLIESRDLVIPNFRAIVASSELLPTSTHVEASKKFNAKVLNYYGQAERVCLSYSIDGLNHFFHPAYGRVELHHAYDDGDASNFEIIGTSFWNMAQPIVRYRTGDFAALPIGASASEIEEICLGLRSFKGIVGRQSEYLIAPNGEHLIGINHIPRGIPDIVQMQLHQKNMGRVEIWVVPQSGFGKATEKTIIESARRRIPLSIAIDIVTVEQLLKTARGKAPLVVRSTTLEN